ncbi:hypothetical protein LCGC14_3020880, partial [marine sediment metagenome]
IEEKASKKSLEDLDETIFEESEEEMPVPLVIESPFILKVVSGPNAGSEFGMEKSKSYIIGKDSTLADIIFADLSVSGQNTKITIDENNNIFIQDLGSKNGTYVNNKQIKEKTNIIGVIGEYVNLKSSGQNYKGLCPFHSEKTPSFTVSPHKNIFHCFGCGVGGNVFNFLMKFKGISFPDAVKMLGERAGIQVNTSKSDRNFAEKRDVIYQIIQKAASAYVKALFSNLGTKAIEYLKGRNIDTGTIKSFKIGYAPERWDAMLSYLKAEGYSNEKIEEAGLIIKKKSGSGYYDRFRNRIIFPIQDNIGRVIGFGGRDFGNNDPNIPKYINTVENTVFHKGRYLYGFNESEQSIRKEGSLFIVE